MEGIETFLKHLFQTLVKQPALNFGEELSAHLQKLLKAGIGLIGAMAIFVISGAFFIDRFLDQLDQGQVVLTNSLLFLISIMIADLFVMLIIASKLDSKNKGQASPSPEMGPSPLETAISVLILDFVKEREEKREKAAQSTTPEDGPKYP